MTKNIYIYIERILFALSNPAMKRPYLLSRRAGPSDKSQNANASARNFQANALSPTDGNKFKVAEDKQM